MDQVGERLGALGPTAGPFGPLQGVLDDHGVENLVGELAAPRGVGDTDRGTAEAIRPGKTEGCTDGEAAGLDLYARPP